MMADKNDGGAAVRVAWGAYGMIAEIVSYIPCAFDSPLFWWKWVFCRRYGEYWLARKDGVPGYPWHLRFQDAPDFKARTQGE